MDYKNIDKDFGTLEDFKALIDDCHKRTGFRHFKTN